MDNLNQTIYQPIDSYQKNVADEINGNQLLRINDVSKLTSLGKSTINLWVAQGKFPKPIHLSSTIKVWQLYDVLNWINSFKEGDV